MIADWKEKKMVIKAIKNVEWDVKINKRISKNVKLRYTITMVDNKTLCTVKKKMLKGRSGSEWIQLYIPLRNLSFPNQVFRFCGRIFLVDIPSFSLSSYSCLPKDEEMSILSLSFFMNYLLSHLQGPSSRTWTTASQWGLCPSSAHSAMG
jgi:hypothetical protein